MSTTDQPNQTAIVTVNEIGETEEGKIIKEFTFTNKNNVTVKVINIAGAIKEIIVPDKKGNLKNIALGFLKAEDYAIKNIPHFGALVGRFANRIANGKFTLNGTNYTLPLNNGEHTLHGGPATFAKDVWEAEILPTTKEDTAAIKLTYTSPDKQNGFPGTVQTTVIYSLNNNNEFSLQYTAKTDKDTVINLTNHSYFNLAGEGSGSIENQYLQIFATNYTPTDKNSNPTGEIVTVEKTPLDFRELKRIGKDIRSNFNQIQYARGFDHNWVLDGYTPNATKPFLAAYAVDKESGRTMEVYTTEPGLQFYTANSLDGSYVGTSGRAYRQTDGFALEAEHFPNSPNISHFPTTVLKVGEIYQATTIYKFGIVE